MERIKMSTKIMPVSDLRRETSAVIRGIQATGDVVYITQHGRPAAVLLDCDQYEALLAQSQRQGWPPRYFAQTYGALADDLLTRPEQGMFEAREALQ
jgi:prevent-host-death family protein